MFPTSSPLFDICARESSLEKSFKCCLDNCGRANICKALCRNVYPGTIPEDCASQIGCMHAEYFDEKCIKEQELKFRQCCVERCRAQNWSDETSFGRYFGGGNNQIDCNAYCDNIDNILVNVRYGSPPGS